MHEAYKEKANILIVEDDPIIAADLQDRLDEMGYHVLGTVAVGEDAPAYFEKPTVPDLVIMDINLEGEWNGIETTRHIQAKSEVPIIFLTSNSDEATFNEARQVNPQAFLTKPFRGRDLKYAIELAIVKAANSKNSSTNTSVAEESAYLLKDRLFIKAKDRMVRIFFKDILWVEADDYYCKVVTNEREFLVTQTLKKFSEELLSVPNFMRVHRSYIVNLVQVDAIGEAYLHIGQAKIQVSRTLRDELLAKLKGI